MAHVVLLAQVQNRGTNPRCPCCGVRIPRRLQVLTSVPPCRAPERTEEAGPIGASIFIKIYLAYSVLLRVPHRQTEVVGAGTLPLREFSFRFCLI